jgi:glycosyltransferase involved in cell wall biosynthesis
VLSNLSLVEDLEGRRDLLLQGDLLLQPEAAGEQRSILLEAMARGVLVIAGRDPLVSVLVDGRTARLVDPGAVEQWQRVFADVLSNPASAVELASAARTFVSQQRRASDHVLSVLRGYEVIAQRRAAALVARSRAARVS